jgi:hypothetical protein
MVGYQGRRKDGWEGWKAIQVLQAAILQFGGKQFPAAPTTTLQSSHHQ